jgi:hypothetical protein
MKDLEDAYCGQGKPQPAEDWDKQVVTTRQRAGCPNVLNTHVGGLP